MSGNITILTVKICKNKPQNDLFHFKSHAKTKDPSTTIYQAKLISLNVDFDVMHGK